MGSIDILLMPRLRTILFLFTIALVGCSDHEEPTHASYTEPAILFFAATALLPETNNETETQLIRFDRSLIIDHDTLLWQLETYDLPTYHHSGIHLQHQMKITTGPELIIASENRLTFRIPVIRYPTAAGNDAVWLLIRPQQTYTNSELWFAPAFTPDVAEAAMRETLRRSRLSESMADDAYFFGYSTNEDALE